ncbi:MAG: T9SS type A sorting domain-containing protein [Prevotellaceae bacterium]|jgi:hypothetical protein|nr:T9SS type A sorting domain-containing protein [Prevotellaceae bacterium]
MKKLLRKSALLLIACAAMATVYAQPSKPYLVDDFEGPAKAWRGVGAGSFSVELNVEKVALNPSHNALKLVRAGASDGNWAGSILDFSEPIKGYSYAHVKMYRTNTGIPNLKVSDNLPSPSFVLDLLPVTEITIVDSVWQDVVFDISAFSENGINFVMVMVDRADITEEVWLQIDDIVLSNDATPRTAGIAAAAKIDQHVYPALGEDQQYSLVNNWIYSAKEENYAGDLLPGASGMVRAMIEKEGKIYFPDRGNRRLVVVDAATGERLAPVALPDTLFTYHGLSSTGEDSLFAAGTLAFNDLKLDNAGNALLGNCVTSQLQPFQIWKVDLATGEGSLLIDEVMGTDYSTTTLRFDAFGVLGDVNQDAIIMAANASAMEVYWWKIEGGIITAKDYIELDPVVWPIGDNPAPLANPGTAPQVFPLDINGGLFYLDGNATHPTLYDFDGNLVDGFFNNAALLNQEGVVLNEGHNGLCEFELNEKFYFLSASRNTVTTDGGRASFFTLFQYKDANKSFADAKRLWSLPDAGMGGVSNPYRTGAVSVSVTDNVAQLYIYVGENGYAAYTLTDADGAYTVDYRPATVSKTTIDVFVNGNQVILSEMADVEIYSLLGQRLATDSQVSQFTIAQKGIYLIKAIDAKGISSTHKIVIK